MSFLTVVYETSGYFKKTLNTIFNETFALCFSNLVCVSLLFS